MALPDDVVRWIEGNFIERDRAWALDPLRAAVIHTGETANVQLVRCAAMGSGGTKAGLQDMLDLLRVDWRDVIMAGEVGLVDGKLQRLRDLTGPLPP